MDDETRDTIASNGHVSVELADDATLAEGRWVELRDSIPGLRVLICQYGTKEGNRVSAAAVKKFGGPKAGDLNDLKPEKRQAALAWIMATAHFKSFRAGDHDEFEIRSQGQARGEGRTFKDTKADREALVADYKLVREELDAEISALGEAEQERVEGIAGN